MSLGAGLFAGSLASNLLGSGERSRGASRARGDVNKEKDRSISNLQHYNTLAQDSLMQDTELARAALADSYLRMMSESAPYAQAGTQTLDALSRNALGNEASPLYKFQKEKGEEAINRQLAKRGLYNSGAGIELLSDFYNRLGAEETERTNQRQQFLADFLQPHLRDRTSAQLNQGRALAGLYGQRGGRISDYYNRLGSNIADVRMQSALGSVKPSLAQGEARGSFWDTVGEGFLKYPS